MIQNPTDYTENIVELLNLLDGVSVRSHYLTSAMLNIYLTVETFESLYELHYCTEGANTRFRGYTRCNPNALKDIANPAHAIEHLLEFSDTDNFDNLLTFAIFLVWQLYANGKLSKKEANHLLDLWGGASIEQKYHLTQ